MKMWIVKREVLARNIIEAAKNYGRIYCIEEASKEFQPDNNKPIEGFKNKKNKK